MAVVAFIAPPQAGAELLLDDVAVNSNGAWDVSIVVSINQGRSFIFDDLDGLVTIDEFTAQAIAGDGSVVLGHLGEGTGVWNKADDRRSDQWNERGFEWRSHRKQHRS